MIPASVAATGYILSDGTVPTANDTVTVGGKVYKFVASATTTANEVTIGSGGAAVADTMANLAAAINLGAGSGTKYGSATALNDLVWATSDATKTYVHAKVPGTVGNSLTLAEAGSHTSASGSTLSGGTGSLATSLFSALAHSQMNSELEAAFGTTGTNPIHV